ncbi:MAG TPA: hypothetical protein VIM65_01455 [Cyclobacteriaceae bacterium]
MSQSLNLIKETLEHFNEGAKSVRAYTDDTMYIITRVDNSNEFWVATEEPGFAKVKTDSLAPYFTAVFGIEAKY